MAKCASEKCDRSAVRSRKFCYSHYRKSLLKWSRCSEPECTRDAVRADLCWAHYRRKRTQGKVCSYTGCAKRAYSASLCKTHYDRERQQCRAAAIAIQNPLYVWRQMVNSGDAALIRSTALDHYGALAAVVHFGREAIMSALDMINQEPTPPSSRDISLIFEGTRKPKF